MHKHALAGCVCVFLAAAAARADVTIVSQIHQFSGYAGYNGQTEAFEFPDVGVFEYTNTWDNPAWYSGSTQSEYSIITPSLIRSTNSGTAHVGLMRSNANSEFHFITVFQVDTATPFDLIVNMQGSYARSPSFSEGIGYIHFSLSEAAGTVIYSAGTLDQNAAGPLGAGPFVTHLSGQLQPGSYTLISEGICYSQSNPPAGLGTFTSDFVLSVPTPSSGTIFGLLCFGAWRRRRLCRTTA